jgi:hypothetical protein
MSVPAVNGLPQHCGIPVSEITDPPRHRSIPVKSETVMVRRCSMVVSAVNDTVRCCGGSVSAGNDMPLRSIVLTTNSLQGFALGAVCDRPPSQPHLHGQISPSNKAMVSSHRHSSVMRVPEPDPGLRVSTRSHEKTCVHHRPHCFSVLLRLRTVHRRGEPHRRSTWTSSLSAVVS